MLDEQPVEELSFIAADALVRGIDSPLLREAAGASPANWFQSRDTFVAALEELGLVADMNEQDALWRLIRNTAQLIVNEETGALDGANQIWHWRQKVDAEGDLRIFVGLASELEDHPQLHQEIEEQIRRAAAALLARESPRTWVRMQPRVDIDWPLWKPKPRRILRTDEVPCSSGLVDRLRQWQSVYARHALPAVPQGVSIFTNPADALAFVETGRELAELLQSELGDDWHVEYYPEPTKPYNGFRGAG